MLSKYTGISLIIWVACFHNRLAAQSPYRVAVAGSEQAIVSGFLKMGSDQSPTGEILSYTNAYLTRNGKPWYPVMGEMHFSRVAARDWESSILKMKSGGIQIISTYVFWNHHEATEGVFDWTGNNNLQQFLLLCQKHGMYVWLRPGPWVHAEARNGGFPDWLVQKKLHLRQNDSTYLQYVQQFFTAIGRQCNGYWFKQGGPLIGVQVENELVFKNPDVYAHMKRLKQLAMEAGMDVPYYSAFAQGPDNQDEFLYMIGSYPDSPWNSGTKKMVKPVYFIKPLEADRDIGSDLLGKVDGRVRNTYPKLSAELGGGMQVTYHRRVVVNADDIAANIFTKIASGLNGVGYYMYHGGINPTGITPLQESRATGYPNDVPLINYDFEAPLDATGVAQPSYKVLRMLHLFLADFGAQLAETVPYFPEVRKTIPVTADTVQCSARLKDGKGFIFLANYQRHVSQPAMPDFQIRLADTAAVTTLPASPITFSANSYMIWPYRMAAGNSVLSYATAQPLCVLHNAEPTYVFFSKNAAELVFDKATIKGIQVQTGKPVLKGAAITCAANETVTLLVTANDGTAIQVMVLPEAMALNACKVKAAGREYLVMSEGTVYQDDKALYIEQAEGQGDVGVTIYPALQLTAAEKDVTCRQQQAMAKAKGMPGTFYRLVPAQVQQGSVQFQKITTPYDTLAAEQLRDSLYQQYALGKHFTPAQQGPLYQLQYRHLPVESTYRMYCRLPATPSLAGWNADIYYTGDVLAMYRQNRLYYDQFNYENRCRVHLRTAANGYTGEWLLQLLPLPAGSNIYVEDAIMKSKEEEWNRPALKEIVLHPVYRYTLRWP